MLSKQRLVIIAVAGGILLLLLLVFSGILPGLRRAHRPANTVGADLVAWGVFDEGSVIESALQDAGAGASITYRQMSSETYEQDLVNALAAGRGPDVFMFHNTWLPKHNDKIVPATDAEISILTLQQNFPLAVQQDFAPDGVIYALPLYLDTLALFYNQDIFDQKGIAVPPKSWSEFEDVVSRLREVDARGTIVKAAAAIGGSGKSINRASDLLALLMIQSGTPMIQGDFAAASFGGREGFSAFSFYTKFANPAESRLYTWNDSMKYSLDAFADGDVAMIFNYAYQLKAIKEKNPFLRVGIAPMPQGSGSVVNYPNYWGLAVSNKSANPGAAWQLINNLATNPDIIRKYLKDAKHPPALLSLIDEERNDPEWHVFAAQALSARSWPQIDNTAVDRAFSQAIADVLTGRRSPDAALGEAQTTISDLMERRKQPQ